MNEQRIIDACPRIYGELTHFACGSGWEDLLVKMSEFIAWKIKRWDEVVQIKDGFLARGEEVPQWIHEYFKERPEDPWEHFRVVHVKEKFGGLRFYTSCYPNIREGHEIMGMIAFAEKLSTSICERCAAPGAPRNGAGWTFTLCDGCALEEPS